MQNFGETLSPIEPFSDFLELGDELLRRQPVLGEDDGVPEELPSKAASSSIPSRHGLDLVAPSRGERRASEFHTYCSQPRFFEALEPHPGVLNRLGERRDAFGAQVAAADRGCKRGPRCRPAGLEFR